jgi:membrane protein DedA with SNARE-associated domain
MEEFKIFFSEYGIWALAGILFLDDLGLPLPGTTLLFAAAVLASQDFPGISLYPLLAIALFIPPICNGIIFFLGRHGTRGWLKTHGHKFFLPEKKLQKAERFFEKYGEKTVFFVGLVLGLRAVTSLTAGSLGMKPQKFFLYHFLGLLIWVSITIGGGYLFGEEIFKTVKHYWEFLLIGVGVFIIGKIIWSRFIEKKNSQKSDS